MSRIFPIVPVVTALTGAATGICWAMLYRATPSGRVSLDDSMPGAMCGVIVGFVVGVALEAASYGRPTLRSALGIMAVTLLCGSVAAPFGWIFGDNQPEREPRKWMLCAAIGGTVVGFGLGVAQWMLER